MSYHGLGATLVDPQSSAAACAAVNGKWLAKPFGGSYCDQSVQNACVASGGRWISNGKTFYCYQGQETIAVTGKAPPVAAPAVKTVTSVVYRNAPPVAAISNSFNLKKWAPYLAGAGALLFIVLVLPRGGAK